MLAGVPTPRLGTTPPGCVSNSLELQYLTGSVPVEHCLNFSYNYGTTLNRHFHRPSYARTVTYQFICRKWGETIWKKALAWIMFLFLDTFLSVFVCFFRNTENESKNNSNQTIWEGKMILLVELLHRYLTFANSQCFILSGNDLEPLLQRIFILLTVEMI